MAEIFKIPLFSVISYKWQTRKFPNFPYLTHFFQKMSCPYLKYRLYLESLGSFKHIQTKKFREKILKNEIQLFALKHPNSSNVSSMID